MAGRKPNPGKAHLRSDDLKPRSINIFLLDRDPNGIRAAQISMSTIQAFAFRRNQLRRVREAFPEIERPDGASQ